MTTPVSLKVTKLNVDEATIPLDANIRQSLMLLVLRMAKWLSRWLARC